MNFYRCFRFYITQFTLLAGILAYLSNSYANSTTNFNFYQIQLERLQNFSIFNTQKLQGRPSLWVSFQPSCSSCKTQIKDLSCLPHHIHKLVVGLGGTKKDLNDILRPLNFEGESFIASSSLEKSIALNATPTILIVSADGNLQSRLVGVTDCQILKTYFKTKPNKGDLK
jgi:hypothetical protein